MINFRSTFLEYFQVKACFQYNLKQFLCLSSSEVFGYSEFFNLKMSFILVVKVRLFYEKGIKRKIG